MIDKKELSDFIESRLGGTDLFLVEVKISKDNEIIVEIDSDNSVDIDRCVELTREIEERFDRDDEDYELEVGSAGLTAPFKVKAQYDKNIGNAVEVVTRDGRKLHGVLTSVSDDFTECEVTVTKKVKEAGKKRPVMVEEPETLAIDNIKSITYEIKF